MDHATQVRRAETFAKLHKPGEPIVLVNIWDSASAAAVAKAGAKALATSSVAVAQAQGFDDGEQLPRPLLMEIAARIAAAHDLPLTVDSETGYGRGPQEVGETVRLLAGTGAIGMNLEDQAIGEDRLRDTGDQVLRIAAARSAADKTGVPFFINARTDIFLKTPREQHGEALVREALERAKAYAGAGANGIYPIGLADPALIGAFCAGSPLPVNIYGMAGPAAELARLGAARISLGPRPFRQMMRALEASAADYQRTGILPPL